MEEDTSQGGTVKWQLCNNLSRPWRMTTSSLRATYISFSIRLWLADHRKGRLINHCLHVIIHPPLPWDPHSSWNQKETSATDNPIPWGSTLTEDWEEHPDHLPCCSTANLAYQEQIELAQQSQDLTSKVYQEAKEDGDPEVDQFLWFHDRHAGQLGCWKWLIELWASSEGACLNLQQAWMYLEDVHNLLGLPTQPSKTSRSDPSESHHTQRMNWRSNRGF